MPIVTSRLAATTFNTPLGEMVAFAADQGLCLLEFADRPALEAETRDLEKHFNQRVTPADHPIFIQLNDQLAAYFRGDSKVFNIALYAPGTEFQQAAWNALLNIPTGETRSYAQQAQAIDNPQAVRAVARANGQNRIAIIIPCHRIIGSDGSLTGYGGGIHRKQWLLDHEQAMTGAALFA